MRAVVVPSLVTVLVELASACTLCACAASYGESGRTAAAAASLPVAVEYFAAGVRETPDDPELRADLILAMQTHLRETRRSIEDLIAGGQHRRALNRLVVIDELLTTGRELGLPGEVGDEIARQRAATLGAAIDELERDLDERAGRGEANPSDLSACRELETIAGDDSTVSQRCARLLDRFKLYATVEVDGDAGPDARTLAAALEERIAQQNPQLLEVVPRGHPKHNARIVLFVGAAETLDVDWHVARREEIHGFVPRLDRKGKPIFETVTVKRSPKEMQQLGKALASERAERAEAARRTGRPPPEEPEVEISPTKEVRKQVFDPVFGELSIFVATRAVTVPWSVSVGDLRARRLVVVQSGVRAANAGSTYHEYRGDERARRPLPGVPEGRDAAVPLAGTGELTQRALGGLPAELASGVIDATD